MELRCRDPRDGPEVKPRTSRSRNMTCGVASIVGCWQHRKLTDALLDISENDAHQDAALVANSVLVNSGVDLVSPWQATTTLSVRIRTKKQKSYGKSQLASEYGGEYGAPAKWDPANCYATSVVGNDSLAHQYVPDNGCYRAAKLARKLEIQTGVRRNTEKLSPEQKAAQPESKPMHRDSESDRKSEDSNDWKRALNSPPSNADRSRGSGLPAIQRYPVDIRADVAALSSGDFNRLEISRQIGIKCESNLTSRNSPRTRPDSAGSYDLPAIEVPLTRSFGCRKSNLHNCRPFDDAIIAHVQRLEVKSSKLSENGEQRSRSEPVPTLVRGDALSTGFQTKHPVPLSLHPLDAVTHRPTPDPLGVPLFPVRVSEAMKEARIDIQKLSPKATTKTVSLNNGYTPDFASGCSSPREFGLLGWTKARKSPRKTIFLGHHLRSDAQPGVLNGALIYRSDTVSEDMFSVKHIDTASEQRNVRHSFNDVLAPRESSPLTASSNGTSINMYVPLGSAVSGCGSDVHDCIWTSASTKAPRYIYKQNMLSKELQQRFMASTNLVGDYSSELNLLQAKAKTGRAGHHKRTNVKGGSSKFDVGSGGFMGVLIGQTRQRTRKNRPQQDVLPEISGQRIKSKVTTDVNQ